MIEEKDLFKHDVKPVICDFGEVFCISCGGFGFENGQFGSTHRLCRVCSGSGKIDWLEELLIRFQSNKIH